MDGMKHNIKHVTISLVLHTAVIAAFLLQFNHNQPRINYGNSKHQVVSSYLFDAKDLAKTRAHKVTQHKIIKQLKHAIALTRKRTRNVVSKNKHSAVAQRHAQVAGKPMPELIAILHRAIQREQHYPASAQAMEREGRVRLTFTLLENGTIENLRIAQSSGTTSLDNAALAAIQHALPFKKIDKFIHSPQTYQLDVVFKLT